MAYLDLTDDIPLWALDKAMTWIMGDSTQEFRPHPGKIREAAAIAIENARRYITGRSPQIDPIDRSRDLPTSAIDFALRKGREMVGQPDPDPTIGFLTERYARTVRKVHSSGGLTQISSDIRGALVEGAQIVLGEQVDERNVRPAKPRSDRNQSVAEAVVGLQDLFKRYPKE